MNLEFVDPTALADWDRRMAALPEATVFHTAGWARTLMDAYRYVPRYAVWQDGDTIRAVAPLMEVASVLTGRRGVSLPFTDYCDFLTDGCLGAGPARQVLAHYAADRGWRSVEVRDASGGTLGCTDGARAFFVHELDLTPGEDQLLAGVRDSTRRNIRKSRKLDVEIREENNAAGLAEFVRLNALTRRDHGLPPQPRTFFQCLLKHLIQEDMGRILLAYHGESCIAAAVFLHFNGHVVYKYGASDRKFRSLRANNLIMWEAIIRCRRAGNRTFHFGRTEPENEGLLQFKRGWGAKEGAMVYRRYDCEKRMWSPRGISSAGIHNRIFARMPLGALILLGRVLYRHMG